jgi:hypothetical protein
VPTFQGKSYTEVSGHLPVVLGNEGLLEHSTTIAGCIY